MAAPHIAESFAFEDEFPNAANLEREYLGDPDLKTGVYAFNESTECACEGCSRIRSALHEPV